MQWDLLIESADMTHNPAHDGVPVNRWYIVHLQIIHGGAADERLHQCGVVAVFDTTSFTFSPIDKRAQRISAPRKVNELHGTRLALARRFCVAFEFGSSKDQACIAVNRFQLEQ